MASSLFSKYIQIPNLLLTDCTHLPCQSVLPTAARSVLIKLIRSCHSSLETLLKLFPFHKIQMHCNGLQSPEDLTRHSELTSSLSLTSSFSQTGIPAVFEHTGASFLTTLIFNVSSLWSNPTSTTSHTPLTPVMWLIPSLLTLLTCYLFKKELLDKSI